MGFFTHFIKFFFLSFMLLLIFYKGSLLSLGFSFVYMKEYLSPIKKILVSQFKVPSTDIM